MNSNTQYWTFCGIDDGNLLFDASLERRTEGLPILHDLLSTVRKSKINIFCCTQTPHQIGASIHSNSAIKIMFSHANAKDLDFMFKSIGNLSKEQKEYCYTLGCRQIVIKNTKRFPIPVLGLIPEIPSLGEISDEDVMTNNRLILSFLPEIVPRDKPGNSTPSTDETKKPEEKPKEIEVTDQEKSFLWAVNFCQYKKTLTGINIFSDFTSGTGSRLAAQCEKKNLIKMIRVKIGKGNPKYPVLLPQAYKVLGIKERKFYGKGAGFEHVLYQHLIADYLINILPDAKIIIELHRGNKHIDVAVETNERLVVIEVAMTAMHEKVNIEKDLNNAQADLVITACRNEQVLKKVKKKVSELLREMQSKVRVCLVSEIFKMKPKDIVGQVD
jgi:hypothetical protein